jgi:hypothetical protein
MNEFWFNGLLHREDGPALEGQRLGLTYEEYWLEGRLHRQSGPAVRHDCVREEWWVQNQRHREDGPAIDARGRIRLPWMDRDFSEIARLSESPVPWRDFPIIEDRPLAVYFNEVFGGVHPFARCGDYGAMPAVMADALAMPTLELSRVRWRISYEDREWESQFFWLEDDMETQHSGKETDEPMSTAQEPGLMDLLGNYSARDQLITLYLRPIAGCAERLDQIRANPCGPNVMTLVTMVFLHELGHALHHASRGGRPDDDLGGCIPAETVAQHFMMTCTRAHGVRAEWLADRLEYHQPAAYRAWRTCGFPTTWEGCRQLVEQNP